MEDLKGRAFQTRQVDGFAMSMPWPLQPVLDGTAVVIASGADGDPADLHPFGHNIFVTKPDEEQQIQNKCNRKMQR